MKDDLLLLGKALLMTGVIVVSVLATLSIIVLFSGLAFHCCIGV